MSSPKSNLEFIKNNIKHLPIKDAILANEFLSNREFNKLQELIDSALYKITKNLNSNNPKSEYKILDVDAIEELSVKMEDYITQVYGESFKLNASDLEDDDEEYYESFESYDLNDLY